MTWQNPEQLFVAQVLIKKVKLKCCGIKVQYKIWCCEINVVPLPATQGSCPLVFRQNI